MVTARETREFLAPILEQFPDLVLAGRFLVFQPIHHTACGIFIDSLGGKVSFRPWRCTYPLFIPLEPFIFFGGDEIGVTYSLEGTPPVSIFLEKAEKALPDLRKLNSLTALRGYIDTRYERKEYSERPYYARPSFRAIYAVALGDLDEAAQQFEIFSDEYERANFPYKSRYEHSNYQQDINSEVPGLGDRLAEQGNDLGAEDRTALAGVLHTFEEFTVTNLKLNKYWERTPFPLEEID